MLLQGNAPPQAIVLAPAPRHDCEQKIIVDHRLAHGPSDDGHARRMPGSRRHGHRVIRLARAFKGAKQRNTETQTESLEGREEEKRDQQRRYVPFVLQPTVGEFVQHLSGPSDGRPQDRLRGPYKFRTMRYSCATSCSSPHLQRGCNVGAAGINSRADFARRRATHLVRHAREKGIEL